MSEQTATERLRELLDERGVEWDVFSVSNTEYTHWTNNDGRWCAASIGGPLSLHVNILSATPEEAIAATLGDGEGSRDEWRSVALGLFDSLEKADLEEAKRWICDNELLGEEIAYGDADAATLGNDGLERSNNGVERSKDGVAETCAFDDYTAKLMSELVQVMEERDTLRAKLEVATSMWHADYERHAKENAKLRELVDDMWAVMSDHYAADEMADACHMNLGCDMDELEARVRNMGIEVDA